MGFLGFIDVASQMGLDNKPMEMDTVLGKAGMDSGPFLMVPIYGPTTARAAHGDTADNWPYFFFPWYVGDLFKMCHEEDVKEMQAMWDWTNQTEH